MIKMKNKYWIVLLILVLLITGCGKKNENKIMKNSDEIKEVLNKEKDYLDSEHVYLQYLDVSSYKEATFDIEWIEKEENVNIKGTIVNGNIAKSENNDNTIILSKDGVLYRKKDDTYSIIKTAEDVKRIGLYYPHEGGVTNCSTIIEYVLETDSGVHAISFEDNGVIISSKTLEKNDYQLPLCYGNEKGNFDKYLSINTDGEVSFDNIYLVDKITSEKIKANHIIYSSVGDVEKYYIVTDDNFLYIVSDNKTNVEAVAKVTVSTNKVDETDNSDVNINITYKDITLSFKDVANNLK